ncbi:hypothetical protein GCM10022240_12150 [Microbacterium kribbense]|uniref:Uncharacterized protein n=1 Tax=Microbacterium kribbense TaxID=433645 RepID=A0ABP7GBS3_9MICO
MNGRAAVLVGCGTAVASVIAIASVIAFSSAATLADRPGAPLAGSAIVVQGQSQVAAAGLPEVAPVTVPAPEPKEITPAPPRPAPDRPVPPSDTGATPDTPATAPPRDTAKTGTSTGGSITPAPRPSQSRPADPGDRYTPPRPGDSRLTKEKLAELIAQWRAWVAEGADGAVDRAKEDTQWPANNPRLDDRRSDYGPRSQSRRSPDSRD